jgi:antitoxin ParD1/3/4
MNLYLGKHYEEYVKKQVASGKYTSAAEVMRDALRDHESKNDLIALHRQLAEAQAEYDRGEFIAWSPAVMKEIDAELDEEERLGWPVVEDE